MYAQSVNFFNQQIVDSWLRSAKTNKFLIN